MNVQSIIVLIVIASLAILSIRYMLMNKDHCVGCGNKCSGKCEHCKV